MSSVTGQTTHARFERFFCFFFSGEFPKKPSRKIRVSERKRENPPLLGGGVVFLKQLRRTETERDMDETASDTGSACSRGSGSDSGDDHASVLSGPRRGD